MDEKVIEMDNFQIVTALKTLQYDFNRLRNDWEEARTKINERLFEFATSSDAVNRKLKQLEENKLGLNYKEIAKLKALGINPKDLISGMLSKNNEEKT